MNRLFFLTLLLTASLSVRAQQFPLSVKEGKITYHADKQGNRIPDYSSCGYENSNKPIPDVENRVLYLGRKVTVPPVFSRQSTMFLF